jgi:type 1 glutamine amidotransferase
MTPFTRTVGAIALGTVSMFFGATSASTAPDEQAPPPAAAQGAAAPPAAGRGAGRGQGGDPFAGQPRINALVVSGGCCHDWLTQGRALMEAVNKVLPVDWTVAYQGSRGTTSRFPVYNNAAWSKGFDIVVHNECSADISDETFIRSITAGHKTGIPAVVIHCSMHSYRSATIDDWRELLGVTSRRHTAAHAISVKWAADQEIAKGLAENWVTPVDELYVIEKFWPTSKAVATAVSPEDKQEYPLVWTSDYHGARVFGTTLGHGVNTWADPVFQELMARGFKWALKK